MVKRLLPLAATALAAVAFAACHPKKSCPQGETDCGGVCLDLQTDASSCGTCLHACPAGATCDAGACRCPAGQVVCGNACVDLQASDASCGACGHACGLGHCVAGACSCGPYTSCGPAASPECVDAQTDPRNCGACGAACPRTGEACADGTCQCPVALPDACSTRCVDLAADPSNCGACGTTCKPGAICSARACACAQATPTDCGTACANVNTSATNCGSCGNACATGQSCASGSCRCPTGQTLCGSGTAARCTDTATDQRNCGRCGLSCQGSQSCKAGACVTGCSSTQVTCVGTCCDGNACCSGGSACQTVHANGLGQNYYDCAPLDSWTPAEAVLAATVWAPAGSIQPVSHCAGSPCLCTSKGTQAAIWCYAGPGATLAGKVAVSDTSACAAALCPFGGSGNGTFGWH
jgi:hypothetical protein